MPTTEYGVDQFFQNAGTSPKMVYDVAGTLGWSPHNRLLQSQTFDNASWSVPADASIVVNVIAAPDGTLTADKLMENNLGAVHFNAQAVTAPNGVYSVYAKDAGRRYLLLCLSSFPNSAVFDLQSGVVLGTTSLGTVTPGAAIQIVGSGWYRCSIPVSAAGADTIRHHLHNGTTHGYVGDGVSGVYLWGAQLNNGAVPTAYLPTTTAARFGLALDYDPVTHAARGLLCEPVGTNLAIQSSSLDAVGWNKGTGTIAVNAIAAPNGVLEADGYILPVGGGANIFQGNVPTTIGATYTLSSYLKNGPLGNNWFQFAAVSGGTWRAWFNLATGAKGTSAGSPASWNIVNVGNGWYRCDVTFVAGATSTNCYLITDTADGAIGVVNGNGSSPSFYAWVVQCEPGTVATSPIPTLAATVTRGADIYSVTPASINHSATAGSWWVEQYHKVLMAGGRVIGYDMPTTPMMVESAGTFALYDAGFLYRTTVGSLEGSVRKVASAWQVGSRAIAEGGQVANTDAGSTTTLLAPNIISFGNGGGTWQIHGYIRKLRYLPRRPTNAELQTMTT